MVAHGYRVIHVDTGLFLRLLEGLWPCCSLAYDFIKRAIERVRAFVDPDLTGHVDETLELLRVVRSGWGADLRGTNVS